MIDSELCLWREFVSARRDKAYRRLQDRTEYIEACAKQKHSEAIADAVLQQLTKEDRLTILRHYEGELAKTTIEMDEVYVQGMRDGVSILALLGALDGEIH